MSNINQLLAKAMSTTSEEEAMSCLRMARKKGKTFDIGGSTSDAKYKDQTAKYWYEKAAHYYNEAKKRDGDLTREQQTQLYRMYKNAEDARVELNLQRGRLEREISELKKVKSTKAWNMPVILLQAVIIIMLVQFIH